LKVISTIKFQ